MGFLENDETIELITDPATFLIGFVTLPIKFIPEDAIELIFELMNDRADGPGVSTLAALLNFLAAPKAERLLVIQPTARTAAPRPP